MTVSFSGLVGQSTALPLQQQQQQEITVGVLALQGGFDAHIQALNGNAIPVKKPLELKGLSTLIIPGGESSTLLRLMAPLNWAQAIMDFHASGGSLFGTCAGMIMLAKQVEPRQESLGLIDIDVTRNAYGRQLDSFIAEGLMQDGTPLEMLFIRAPKITRVGAGVEILVSHDGEPVMVRQNRVAVASFHPELSDDSPIYNVM